MNSFEAAFANRLQQKLDKIFADRLDALAGGGCLRGNFVEHTGAAYHQEVGYFQALRDVAELMREVESDLLGRQQE